MVKSFLDASRIDLGTLIIEKEMTNIGDLINNELEEQKQRIEEKKLEIEFTNQENTQQILVDPKRIRMVFQNLLSNAVKYSELKSKIIIDITKEGQNLLITFKDTGMGIPELDKDKIFTKLYRAKNVVSSATEGTGLGLYIAKNIVEQSGGKIWFESDLNNGTIFYVRLPIKN